MAIAGAPTTTKFIRNYKMSIQVSEDVTAPYLIIQPPFTLEFSINKDCLSSSSTGSFQIYNLSATHRNQVRKNINDFLTVRKIILQAGYGNNLSVIFNGMIQQAFSRRDGVDAITQIEAADWSFAFISPDSDYYGAPGSSSTQKQLLTNVINKALPSVTTGAIGQGYDVPFGRETSHADSAKNIIQQYTGGSGTSAFFIDNGVANILGQNEAIQAQGIQTINADTGLLGKPIQEANILNFEMIFEPRLLMAQVINLESVTEPQLSGQYKVISIKHHGMISDAVCGDAITSVGLFSPHFPPQNNQFQIIPPVGQP